MQTDKQTFITNFLDQVKQSLLDKSNRIPDNWDGIELRQWVSDTFAHECYTMDRKRKANYKNDTITKNI